MKTLVKVISISFLGLSLAAFAISLYSSTQPCPPTAFFSLCPMGQQLLVGCVCAFISGCVALTAFDTEKVVAKTDGDE